MYVRCCSLFLSSLMAFVCTFRVCHARDLAWELVNGDDGGGLYGKVASNSEDSWPMFLIYTSMVTYITSYKAINTKLIGWGAQPTRARIKHGPRLES